MSSTKINSLKLNRDFRRIYYRGKSVVCQAAAVYYMKNRYGENRLGITVGKKVGNAVLRNRAKRVIRVAYRELLPELQRSGGPAYDLVIVARSKTPQLKSGEITRQLRESLQKAGVL